MVIHTFRHHSQINWDVPVGLRESISPWLNTKHKTKSIQVQNPTFQWTVCIPSNQYHSDPNAAVKLGPGEAQIWPKNVDCLSLGSEWEKLISTVESPSCVALGPFFSTETSKVPRGPSDEWANETKQKKNMQDRPIPRCWLINDSRLNRRIESLYYFLCSWSSSLVGQQRTEIARNGGKSGQRRRRARCQINSHAIRGLNSAREQKERSFCLDESLQSGDLSSISIGLFEGHLIAVC